MGLYELYEVYLIDFHRTIKLKVEIGFEKKRENTELL